MDIHKQRVAALKAIIGNQTLKDFAEKHDLDASYLSQVLNGHRNLGERAAANMEAKIGLPAGILATPYTSANPASSVGESVHTYPPQKDHYPPHQDDYALIPQYTAKGSSGTGYLNDHVEVNGHLAFKRAWLAREKLKEENLKVIYNHGESNWPTLSDGEVLLIDESQVEPRSGKMFAMLDFDGEVIIKRLIREVTGTWLIRSDNPDKTRYPDTPSSDEILRLLKIVGRVVWRGGTI
ncbi:S24 family peptidase [Azotobacter beijerinckii]|uniref:Phage repressor protein C, contains Cro/C1-type HTH and peptisase s24 domains n=1 Tax=Azotobacter beijerinckii TaxID=170623 RepID=A0A1I3ZNC1_9GAMM|nr:S24 family peptidase [Azotobacter beijerinckii]SFK45644.1 Phage repressor protein C, contains Cro/C1-type HTH and peptisase s24 domains [Azotobacter beijerinckii]